MFFPSLCRGRIHYDAQELQLLLILISQSHVCACVRAVANCCCGCEQNTRRSCQMYSEIVPESESEVTFTAGFDQVSIKCSLLARHQARTAES